jgi:hypothetical protein
LYVIELFRWLISPWINLVGIYAFHLDFLVYLNIIFQSIL